MHGATIRYKVGIITKKGNALLLPKKKKNLLANVKFHLKNYDFCKSNDDGTSTRET